MKSMQFLLILAAFVLLSTVSNRAATGQLLETFNDPTDIGGDLFGGSVALEGNKVLIGAKLDDTNGVEVGQVHLFDAQSGKQPRTFDDPTVTEADRFGVSVALDGNRVLIGAHLDDTNGLDVGQVHLFNATTGELLRTFDDPTVTGSDRFGFSVALDGNNVLIGASHDDTLGLDVGQAYLFDATTGNLLQTFNDPTVTFRDWFGRAVALDGNNVLIGAHKDDTNTTNGGQAHLFDAVTGNLLQTFDDPTVTTEDYFGAAVALDGNNVLIGAFWDDTLGTDVGQVHLFDATTGELLRTFNDPTITAGDSFGRSVVVEGNNVLIGASLDDTLGTDVGQAHIFDLVTGNLLQTFNDPNPTTEDRFGRAVALDGLNVLIGAFYDDTNGPDVGQAHLFYAGLVALDFSRDSALNVNDLDSLVGEIVAGTNNVVYDLTRDGAVDNEDLTAWLSAAAEHNGFSQAYLVGDANLDGTVNSSDLNALGQNWLDHPDAWQWGDFNADGAVNAGDLNKLGQNWQQSIPSAASQTTAVPEPTAAVLLVFGLAWFVCRRR